MLIENNEIKILKGEEGYRIVDTSSYNYETGGSIEALSCIFNIDEKELINIIEENKNEIVYFDFNRYDYSSKEEYIKKLQ